MFARNTRNFDILSGNSMALDCPLHSGREIIYCFCSDLINT